MALSSFRPGAASKVFPVARSSTVDLIAAELRAAIFSGGLPVGSPLREAEVSSQLGVSRSPLREAAQRLVQEGLLTAVPGRGLRVALIPDDYVSDVYVARLAVESQAVRELIAALRQSGSSTGAGAGVASIPVSTAIRDIERAFADLAGASERGDAWEIGDADLAFHQALVDSAGSVRLSKMMTTLCIETRIASLSGADGYSVRRSISPTYERLISAIRDLDENAAVEALRRQFEDAVHRMTGSDDSAETVETDLVDEPQEFEPLSTDGVIR